MGAGTKANGGTERCMAKEKRCVQTEAYGTKVLGRKDSPCEGKNKSLSLQLLKTKKRPYPVQMIRLLARAYFRGLC